MVQASATASTPGSVGVADPLIVREMLSPFAAIKVADPVEDPANRMIPLEYEVLTVFDLMHVKAAFQLRRPSVFVSQTGGERQRTLNW